MTTRCSEMPGYKMSCINLYYDLYQYKQNTLDYPLIIKRIKPL